jgi:hypothetical protein
MPALNFQTQFAPKVLAGLKPFTLRAPRQDGRDPKMGDRLYLFTAMRTKQCKKFAEKTCHFSAMIRLQYCWISIPGYRPITDRDQLEIFARADGFESYQAFCQFHKVRAGGPEVKLRMIAWITRKELESALLLLIA